MENPVKKLRAQAPERVALPPGKARAPALVERQAEAGVADPGFDPVF